MGRTTSILSRFPHFYISEDFRNIFNQFIKVFGETLDQAEADLLKVLYAHYVDTADNEGSQGFNTTQKGDLDRLFSLYLENLGGTSQLKQIDRPPGDAGKASDEIYRKRIRGLIEVLKSGASTKEGIIAIVAANLGIVGEDEAAIAARQQIRITEFLPEPFRTDVYQKGLYEKFAVQNPNIIDTTPEIRVRIRSDFGAPFNNPRLVNLTTGASVQYGGVVKHNDVLSFFPNGTAFLNGVSIPVVGTTPGLPPGPSFWRFEASFGLAEARFDRTLFDFSAFEQNEFSQIAAFDVEGSRFDQVVFSYPVPEEQLQQAAVFDSEGSGFDQGVFAFPAPTVEISMALSRLKPGSFRVDVPWDIPGFTEKLDQLSDRPREQIRYIVDKVKAAGVFAVIAYEKKFTEIHELADVFQGSAERQPLEEEHLMEEANFDIGSVQTPYPGGIEHEMSDSLTLSSVFDFTKFDSLNTFA